MSPEVRQARDAILGARDDAAAMQAAAVLSLLGLQGKLSPGDHEAVAPLAEVLRRDARAGIRVAAALALGAFVDGARRRRDRPEAAVERAVEALTGALRDPDAGTRAAALRGLRPLRREALIAPLLALLVDPDPAVRLEVLISLDGLKPLDAKGSIRAGAAALLEDASEPVRRAAAIVAR